VTYGAIQIIETGLSVRESAGWNFFLGTLDQPAPFDLMGLGRFH